MPQVFKIGKRERTVRTVLFLRVDKGINLLLFKKILCTLKLKGGD